MRQASLTVCPEWIACQNFALSLAGILRIPCISKVSVHDLVGRGYRFLAWLPLLFFFDAAAVVAAATVFDAFPVMFDTALLASAPTLFPISAALLDAAFVSPPIAASRCGADMILVDANVGPNGVLVLYTFPPLEALSSPVVSLPSAVLATLLATLEPTLLATTEPTALTAFPAAAPATAEAASLAAVVATALTPLCDA